MALVHNRDLFGIVAGSPITTDEGVFVGSRRSAAEFTHDAKNNRMRTR